MIPMILLGPTGIYVIEVSYLRGRYEAKGDSWNVESGDQYKPAPVNLIQRTQRMARALQVYIERQGVKVPAPIESVLIAGDPGLHIESVRPAIKVMMIDGIKTFVNGLATGRPVMSNEQAHDFADRIVTPRLKKDEAVAPAPEPEPEPRAAWEQWYEEPVQQQEDPRTRGLMNAAAEAKTVHPENLDFAFAEDDDMSAESIPPVKRASPAGAAQTNKPQQLMFGMTPVQLAVIGALALALICILAVFAYVVTTL
jgi:nuclease-like protein